MAGAVASAARRDLLEALASAPRSMSELADQFGMTLPALDKHVRVLSSAGLLRKSKSGRVTRLELVPGSLQPLSDWAMTNRLFWTHHLDRLAGLFPAAPAPSRPNPPSALSDHSHPTHPSEPHPEETR